jgi:acyl-CoA carboxylase subunit beta
MTSSISDEERTGGAVLQAATPEMPELGAVEFPQDPEPHWIRCPGCSALIYRKRYERDQRVCPQCRHHGRLTALKRLAELLDPGSAVPLDPPLTVEDPLEFTDRRPYPERLRDARAATGLHEAVACAVGAVHGHPIVAVAMEFGFLGGSLGGGVGEQIVRAAREALQRRAPLLLITASGGARMQEGAVALMQMVKTSQALAELDEAGVLTIALLTDPTYGGVAASFATLTDVILAEPGTRMGFAGPRVIEQTIKQQLPEGFQTAEFLHSRGLIDDIQSRSTQRETIARLLSVLSPVSPARARGRAGGGEASARGDGAQAALVRQPRELPERDPWPLVRLARHVERPTALDYAGYLLDDFHQLHGDRLSADCPAIIGGVGKLQGSPVVFIGHQKGHTANELVARNFGMATPAGYRKAARLMRLAAKVGVPVVTLIDTPGAYPGLEAEEQGQSLAIAENLRLMSGLPVPIVAVVTGEGGSGGALALAVADRVFALSGAIYSVISPEGCAAILWRDAAAAPKAAAALRLDARELLRNGIADGVILEPEGGAHTDRAQTAAAVGAVVAAALEHLGAQDAGSLVRARRARFRQFGTRTWEWES